MTRALLDMVVETDVRELLPSIRVPTLVLHREEEFVPVGSGSHSTGECEILADDIGGMAVNIGARIGALAGADEVLVSSIAGQQPARARHPRAPRLVHRLLAHTRGP